MTFPHTGTGDAADRATDADIGTAVGRLLSRRCYDEALALLDARAEPVRQDSLRRMCLARKGDLEQAARTGEAVLASGMAEPEDWFRQAEILCRLGRWGEALDRGLRALADRPMESRYVVPPVEAALAQPALAGRLIEETAAICRRHGIRPGPVPLRQSDTLLLPLRLPFYAPFRPEHPAHMGLMDGVEGIHVDVPEARAWPGPAALAEVLGGAFAWVERLMAAHPLVDRASAARYVAWRVPYSLFRETAAALDFASALPLTLGDRPWILWFDNLLSLFQPLFPMEATEVSAAASPAYWMVRAHLESDACVAIASHCPTSFGHIAEFFRSPAIRRKLHFINPYYRPSVMRRPQRGAVRGQAPVIRLLFTSSLGGGPDIFYQRGGVDVLNAFLTLAEEFPNVELIFRSGLPDTLSPRLREAVVAHPRIRWLKDRLSDDAYLAMLDGADLFLMPSVLVFRNGMIEAMRQGIVPVVSDVATMDDFVRDGVNGVTVPGRSGLSPLDLETPALATRWIPLLQAVDRPADPAFHAAFMAALRTLIRDPAGITRLSARLLDEDLPVYFGDADAARFSDLVRDALASADRTNAQPNAQW